ncbi:hypothetical protein BH10BAC6_BH10BAC6_10400 [soil metagenome]
MMKILSMLAFASVVVASCSNDSTTNPGPSITSLSKANMRPDSAQGFLYYSLDGDSVVPFSKRTTNEWDICMAFLQDGGRTRQINIFFNSGTVGVGTTKAYVASARFELVTVADTSKLKTDDTTTTNRIVSIDLTGPGVFIYQPTVRHTIVPSPDKTIVVRTKGGKFVKFQFTSIYKDAVPSPDELTPLGYYHFRYARSTTASF